MLLGVCWTCKEKEAAIVHGNQQMLEMFIFMFFQI